MPRANLAIVQTAAASPTPPTPPSKKHPKYQYYLGAIRSAWNTSSESETKVLALLRDFENATIAWKTSPQAKFEDVLREERLCPISRYRNFKRASEGMSRDQIKFLGLDAVCLIARQPHAKWPRLLRLASDYRKKYGHAPNTQQTSILVRMVVPTENKKPTYTQLLRHNQTLLEVLKENKLRAPRVPPKGAAKGEKDEE